VTLGDSALCLSERANVLSKRAESGWSLATFVDRFSDRAAHYIWCFSGVSGRASY
jgi:hypothetical protein